MGTLRIGMDYDVTRKIVLKLAEILDKGIMSYPVDYEFEGKRVEVTTYNIQKLYDAGLVHADSRDEWERRIHIGVWPTGFTQEGWRFLEAAQDDEVWNAAVAEVQAEGEALNVRPLKSVIVRMRREAEAAAAA